MFSGDSRKAGIIRRNSASGSCRALCCLAVSCRMCVQCVAIVCIAKCKGSVVRKACGGICRLMPPVCPELSTGAGKHFDALG